MIKISKKSEYKYNSLKKLLKTNESINVIFNKYGGLNVRIHNTTIYESEKSVSGFNISAIVVKNQLPNTPTKYISFCGETLIEALRGFKITLDNYINS